MTSMGSGEERFGWTTLSAAERKDTSVSALTEDGAFTTVHTAKTLLYPALLTHPQLQVPHHLCPPHFNSQLNMYIILILLSDPLHQFNILLPQPVVNHQEQVLQLLRLPRIESPPNINIIPKTPYALPRPFKMLLNPVVATYCHQVLCQLYLYLHR